MSYCTKCGKQNTDTAKFCTGCGATITTNILVQPEKVITRDYPSPEKKKNKITWIVIAIASLALGLGVYFIFFNKKKEDGPTVKKTEKPADITTVEIPSSKPESTSSDPSTVLSYTDSYGLLVYKSDCFVIITGSFADEKYARDYVNTLKNQGHTNAGYLWIPNYPSLSGKRFYATFIGPYPSYAECEDNLRTLKVNSKFWYGKKVSYNPEQIEIRIK